MGILKEFRDFAMRGNVIDMAVGIVIGTAFGAIVSSLVADVIMPPIGLLLSGVDFSDLGVQLRAAKFNDVGVEVEPAVILKYGLFINAVIKFIIVAFAVFMVIKLMNKATELAKKKTVEEPASAPEVPADVALLAEIRDLLKQRSA